jgi:hypothetical protein
MLCSPLGLMLTTIKTFRDPWEAHMFRGRLEAERIPAFLASDQHIWMQWQLSVALGGVRVQVPEFFADPAGEVLARCASGACQAELAEMFGDIEERRCPVCGARDIKRRPAAGEFVFTLAVMLLGLPVKFGTSRCTCRVCGHRWQED